MGDFGNNYGKKHLISEELKSAKLFLAIPHTTTITFCYETVKPFLETPQLGKG